MNEKWVELKFDFEFVNDLRIEVSDQGRIRSFTKTSQGRIMKGSEVNGYKSISLKFHSERDEKMEQKLQYLRRQIALLKKAITTDKKVTLNSSISNSDLNLLNGKIASSQELLNELKKKLATETRKSDKKRTIYFSALQHRLIAQYFCNKPTAEHNLVIHLNFNKHDNRAENLKWVTQAESTAHQQNSPYVIEEKKHRKEKLKGKPRNSKLTESTVSIIKKRINEGKALSQLAKQFGVSHTQLLRIKRNENWAEVKPAA